MGFDNKDQWLKDFTEFSRIDQRAVDIPSSLLERVRRRIFPNPWIVFTKVLGLHLAVGFLSLAICNQFGLNPFNTEQSLTAWFMKIGDHNFCMMACGLFFMATTYLLSNFFLSLEELESVRHHEWLQLALVVLISLCAFYFFGGQLVATFVGLWVIGAVIGGYLSIEGSYHFRRAGI